MISDYLRGRVKALGFAFSGLRELWRREKNTRVYLFFTAAALLAAAVLKVSMVELTVLLLIISAIWSAEAINSAIERTVDLVTKEQRPLAKAAKDLAAGSVLILALSSVIIGLVIFLPKIIDLL